MPVYVHALYAGLTCERVLSECGNFAILCSRSCWFCITIFWSLLWNASIVRKQLSTEHAKRTTVSSSIPYAAWRGGGAAQTRRRQKRQSESASVLCAFLLINYSIKISPHSNKNHSSKWEHLRVSRRTFGCVCVCVCEFVLNMLSLALSHCTVHASWFIFITCGVFVLLDDGGWLVPAMYVWDCVKLIIKWLKHCVTSQPKDYRFFGWWMCSGHRMADRTHTRIMATGHTKDVTRWPNNGGGSGGCI